MSEQTELEKWAERAVEWRTVVGFCRWLAKEDPAYTELDPQAETLAYQFLDIDPVRLLDQRRLLLEAQRRASASMDGDAGPNIAT